MDPDLVRQQAEAELEQRARPPIIAKKSQDEIAPIEARLAHAADQTLSPAAMDGPPSSRTEPIRPPRWRVHVQTLFSSSTLAGLAALAAAAWGAGQGLSADEQILLGSGTAVLIAVVYGVLLSVNGNGFTPLGGGH